jgi:hypothetical protein
MKRFGSLGDSPEEVAIHVPHVSPGRPGMDSSRIVRALAVFSLAWCVSAQFAPAAQSGDKHTLAARHRPGELARVELALQVGGEVKFAGEDSKVTTLPMSVLANVGFDEATLAVDAAGRPVRSLRYYDDTRAVIKIDKGAEKPSVAPARRLIVAQRKEKSTCDLYCPSESLAREELDLVDLPGHSLVLDDLLPAQSVALGESWKLTDDTLTALLCLDAVGWSDVQCVLGEVKDQVADIAAAGNVSGATGGIATDIELKIKLKFNLASGRITDFAMLIKEKRAVGHIGPGLDTVAKVLVKITPINASRTLTRELISRAPKAATPEQLALNYAPKHGRFRFDYERRWYITGDEPKLAVLRLLDRGELVAQCNISALPPVTKPVELAEFQRDVERSLGKNFGQWASAGQSTTSAGYVVFRAVVHGTVGQLPIEWVYYLVQDRQGRRVSLAFTYQESLKERFAGADQGMISALRLTEPAAPTAARPSAAAAPKTK